MRNVAAPPVGRVDDDFSLRQKNRRRPYANPNGRDRHSGHPRINRLNRIENADDRAGISGERDIR